MTNFYTYLEPTPISFASPSEETLRVPGARSIVHERHFEGSKWMEIGPFDLAGLVQGVEVLGRLGDAALERIA